MKNAINWFEIPVTNYERAKKFYATILDLEITDHHMPEKNMKYGIFPYDMENMGVGGAIMRMDKMIPSKDGSTVYLNGGDDLNVALNVDDLYFLHSLPIVSLVELTICLLQRPSSSFL